MAEMDTLYERLAGASSLEGDDGAIRITATYEPGAGPTTKVSPPTYRVDGQNQPPYVLEDRRTAGGDIDRVVLLDSRQSQANRCEEKLLEALDAGIIRLPILELTITTHDRSLRITSLSAPHRSRDAYFRDAEDDTGTPFDKTAIGRSLAAVTPDDATLLYLHSPADLVYGVWDSHRGLRMATKFPRVYSSEIVGSGAQVGVRAAGRYDQLTSGGRPAGGKHGEWSPDGKGTKLSELGLGMIPPTTGGPGGASVSSITRMATLSFAGLARVRAGSAPVQARAARAVLAALALLGDRLAFGFAGLFLRSGCDLVLAEESLSWVRRGGVSDPLSLTRDDAVALFSHAVERAEAAGLAWASQPVRLNPQPKLQKIVDEAFLAGAAEDA